MSQTKINYLGTYLRGLEQSEQLPSSTERPAQQIVSALKAHDGSASIQVIHDETGMPLVNLVTTIKSLEGLGVVDLIADDQVSLSPDGSALF